MEPGILIYSLLRQVPAVVALVGYTDPVQGPQTRIYPLRIPEGKPRPALTYQLISNTNDGIAACEIDDEARVQVSVFADTYPELCALAKAVRKALAGYDQDGASIEFAGAVDQFSDPAACYFRSVDFIVEGPAD